MARTFDKFEEIDLRYNLKVLWSFLRKYKLVFIGIISLIIFSELAGFFDNFLFKYLVDKGTLMINQDITIESFGKIIFYSVLVYLGVRLLLAMTWFFIIRLANILESNLMQDIERKSFWHILNLSYRYHINKKTGAIISKFTRGVNKVESFADSFIFNFVPTTFKIVLSIGVILYFDVATAVCLSVMTIAFIFTGVYITNLQKSPQNTANFKEDMLKQNLGDTLLNIETVKYFGKEKRTYSNFRKLSEKLRLARKTFWDYFSWHAGIQTAILGLGIGAIFYFSFTNFKNGGLTLGSIALIYAAVWKLIPQLFGLIQGYREFIRSSVDVDALFKIFKEKNEVKDIQKAKPLRVKDGKIEFKNVYFSYPKHKKDLDDSLFLNDFNLKIDKNSKVALVGPSGSGKTTIIKILYRLFDIDKGKIIIDEQNISNVTQESLRNSLSIVPQEPILFDDTLYFNIAYANPKASRKQVFAAIKFAQLDKLIAQLPKKEKTVVGERGVKLSGGEKQRVSIARAILANKKILVLDEATSALDSHTEKEIQRDLELLMENRTTIMVAHRLSTIMKADKIVVLKNGGIVEVGTHKELINKKGGLYKKLWRLQQGEQL
ncbi:hypothetical protein COY27_02010 [Candidatus Woesearchaeota archaeon CG_4_10_14_0_2_um_filter_33_13]|nr:MAG: hypothetical protein COY27_02010 [Candidatus Woesearchaeota archaeon CG_4_10_14_0_2_um_filter_33_13]